MSIKQLEIDTIALPAGEEPGLSPHRAFVVQFRTRTEEDQELFIGRVEHMVSGQARRFASLEELGAFFTRLLTDDEELPEQASWHPDKVEEIERESGGEEKTPERKRGEVPRGEDLGKEAAKRA